MKQLEVLQSQLLPLKKLKPNTGQIPGLPANPRRITDIQLARLKRSIQQNPEMLSIKEMMVYAYNGEYIVIDGNQRLTVLKGTPYKEVPCKVIPANSTPEQLRAYLIKSDLQFGEWVDEMLSKDWDMQELDDFGMEDVERLDVHEEPVVQTVEAPVHTAPSVHEDSAGESSTEAEQPAVHSSVAHSEEHNNTNFAPEHSFVPYAEEEDDDAVSEDETSHDDVDGVPELSGFALLKSRTGVFAATFLFNNDIKEKYDKVGKDKKFLTEQIEQLICRLYDEM